MNTTQLDRYLTSRSREVRLPRDMFENVCLPSVPQVDGRRIAPLAEVLAAVDAALGREVTVIGQVGRGDRARPILRVVNPGVEDFDLYDDYLLPRRAYGAAEEVA